jgi:hypothetical protein
MSSSMLTRDTEVLRRAAEGPDELYSCIFSPPSPRFLALLTSVAPVGFAEDTSELGQPCSGLRYPFQPQNDFLSTFSTNSPCS